MINKDNYLEMIKEYDVNTFPDKFKGSFEKFGTLTKGGTDWKMYDKNDDIRRIINMYFQKLSELPKKNIDKKVAEIHEMFEHGIKKVVPSEEHAKSHIHIVKPDYGIKEESHQKSVDAIEEFAKNRFKHLSNSQLIERYNSMPDFKTDDEGTELNRRKKESNGTFDYKMVKDKLVIVEPSKKYEATHQDILVETSAKQLIAALRDIAHNQVDSYDEEDEDNDVNVENQLNNTAIIESAIDELTAFALSADSEEKTTAILEVIDDKVAKEISSIEDGKTTVAELNEALDTFYAKIGRPRTTKHFQKNQSIPDAKYHVGQEILFRSTDGWKNGKIEYMKYMEENEFSGKIGWHYEIPEFGDIMLSEDSISVSEQNTKHTKPSKESPAAKEQTTAKGKNISEFKVGDKIQSVHDHKKYVVVKNKGGMSKLREIPSGYESDWNSHNNPHFVKFTGKVEKPVKVKPAPKVKVKVEKPVKKGKFDDATPIERESEAVKIIRRYILLNGKQKYKEQIMNIIDALQKAISERRITKADPHAKEIVYVQKELVKFFNGYKGNGLRLVELLPAEMDRLSKIAYSEVAMISVRLIKRYIALDGKTNVKEKAKDLLFDIRNSFDAKKWTSSDKYSKALDEATENLEKYISGKTNVISVWNAELNGVKDFFHSAQHAAKSTFAAVKRVGQKSKELYKKAKPHLKKAAEHIKKHVSSALEERKSFKAEHSKDLGIKFVIARPKGQKATEVQSVLFRTSEWNVPSAERWLIAHGFDAKSIDEKEKSLRFRQHSPSNYTPKSFRTIRPGSKEQDELGIIFPSMVAAATAAVTSTLMNHHLNKKKEGFGGISIYDKLAKKNVWGLESSDIRSIEEGDGWGAGHWNFSKVGKEYEAVYDDIYMHVFKSLNDLMYRKNEKDFFTYSNTKSDERGEETFVNEKGKIRDYLNGLGKRKADRKFGTDLSGTKEDVLKVADVSRSIPNVDGVNFQDLANVQAKSGGFVLKGDIGKLMGHLERNRLAVTIEGDKGAGKTQFIFQLADAFASALMNVAILELEMPVASENIKRMRDMYIKPSNLQSGRIKITDSLPKGLETVRAIANDFDVIILDTWTKLDVDSMEFDRLRNDFPNTIWIVVFQLASNKVIRGGSQPLFDSGINIEVKKVDNTFMNNYAIATKNRYGETGLAYNICFKTLVNIDSEK